VAWLGDFVGTDGKGRGARFPRGWGGKIERLLGAVRGE